MKGAWTVAKPKSALRICGPAWEMLTNTSSPWRSACQSNNKYEQARAVGLCFVADASSQVPLPPRIYVNDNSIRGFR